MNLQVEVEFLEAIHSRAHVIGLTHGFHRYPARFSPLFARAAMKLFTKHGDIVLDPFMGNLTHVRLPFLLALLGQVFDLI